MTVLTFLELLKLHHHNIIIIIIIIIVVVVVVVVVGKYTISFMQGIYTYIPETNHVPMEYSVAAVLFMVPISLVSALALVYFYISTFRSICVMPNMTVFCSYLTSWFPGMVLTYLLNDFKMVPFTPIITGITLVFTFIIIIIIIIIIVLVLEC
jgi:hypothetical protein